jgi:hypothetical protein
MRIASLRQRSRSFPLPLRLIFGICSLSIFTFGWIQCLESARRHRSAGKLS